ncbi:MAG: diguanylate cyclase [Pseudomonadales bacterium]
MSHSDSNWKRKYFTALDEQERREHKQQQLMSLLMRAVVRISLVADGVDQKLDKQLAGLRQMLRDGSPSGRDLNTVVDALEGQVKRLDTVKSERAKVIASAYQSLVAQLQKLKPKAETKKRLKRLNNNLKQRSGLIQEYSALVNELATVQQAVLQDGGDLRISKPFWHTWVVKDSAAKALANQQVDKTVSQPIEKETIIKQQSSPQRVEGAERVGLDLSDDVDEPREPLSADAVGEEPPFSRLNTAICEILSELLEQIEPPEMAKDNYKVASQRLAMGLNWYELVPTLEDISIVVISAFDSHQKDFEGFLTQLNKRLSEAYHFIGASEKAHDDGREASLRLNESMREHVSAMQQSVDGAAELEQLKIEVSTRLDGIVAAMDHYQSSEQQRGSTLSEQLDALVNQVKTMETASEDAEQRIEEQRQKALRDVLTQLPNREAYQQRLEQEFERWQRYDRPLTMVMCDIDHFKRINDTYGHLAGDKVLRIIAKSLRKRLRKTDFIARYGGEEFVVLMPETGQEPALNVVEGVREAIASCPFHFKEQPVSITLSFGIAEFIQGDQAEQVFARSDKALYQAKEQGRNRCILAEPPNQTP